MGIMVPGAFSLLQASLLQLPALIHTPKGPLPPPARGVARLPFTARVERPQLYRGGSASTKGHLAAPFPSFQVCSFTSSGTAPVSGLTAAIERDYR